MVDDIISEEEQINDIISEEGQVEDLISEESLVEQINIPVSIEYVDILEEYSVISSENIETPLVPLQDNPKPEKKRLKQSVTQEHIEIEDITAVPITDEENSSDISNWPTSAQDYINKISDRKTLSTDNTPTNIPGKNKMPVNNTSNINSEKVSNKINNVSKIQPKLSQSACDNIRKIETEKSLKVAHNNSTIKSESTSFENQDEFKAAFINAGGLVKKKLSDILHKCVLEDVELVCIIETWKYDLELLIEENHPFFEIVDNIRGDPVKRAHRYQKGYTLLRHKDSKLMENLIHSHFKHGFITEFNNNLLVYIYKTPKETLYLDEVKDYILGKNFNIKILCGDFNLERNTKKNNSDRDKIIEIGVNRVEIPDFTYIRNDQKTKPDEIHSDTVDLNVYTKRILDIEHSLVVFFTKSQHQNTNSSPPHDPNNNNSNQIYTELGVKGVSDKHFEGKFDKSGSSNSCSNKSEVVSLKDCAAHKKEIVIPKINENLNLIAKTKTNLNLFTKYNNKNFSFPKMPNSEIQNSTEKYYRPTTKELVNTRLMEEKLLASPEKYRINKHCVKKMIFENHEKICKNIYNNFTAYGNFTTAVLKTYSKAITRKYEKRETTENKKCKYGDLQELFVKLKEDHDLTVKTNKNLLDKYRKPIKMELRNIKGQHNLIDIETNDHKAMTRLTKDIVERLKSWNPEDLLSRNSQNSSLDPEQKVKFFIENFFVNNVQNDSEVLKLEFSKDFYISVEEAELSVQCIKTGKATDAFNISNEFLNIKSPTMFKIMSKIFTDMLTLNGNIDKEMKLIKLVAIPKSDGSFRPICINTCLKSLLDSIILNRINIWISENNIITNRQIGFMANHNILDHVFVVKELVKRSNNNSILNFIDLKKAYNNIERALLYDKLINYYNIPPDLLNLIKVSIEENYIMVNEEECSIKKGLPQGNKISPILFNLFINDLINHLQIYSRGVFLFADDITFLTYDEKSSNKCMELLHEYCVENHLTVNTKKSVTLASHKLEEGVFYNGEKLKDVEKFKFLGITLNKKGIDTNANLSECRKLVYFKTHFLNKFLRTNNITNLGVITNLAKMFIVSNVNFFWFLGLENEMSVGKLEILKKKVFKILFGLPQRFSSDKLNCLVRMENFENLIKRCAVNFATRIEIIDKSMVNKWLKTGVKDIKSKKRLKNYIKIGGDLEKKEQIITELMEEVFGMVIFKKTPFADGKSMLGYKLMAKEIKRIMEIEVEEIEEVEVEET